MENQRDIAVVNAVLKYNKKYGTTPLKLQQLLYLIAKHYADENAGASLLNERFQKWKYGPVVPSVYEEFKNYGNKPIAELARDEKGKSYIHKRLIRIKNKKKTSIDHICGKYKNTPATELMKKLSKIPEEDIRTFNDRLIPSGAETDNISLETKTNVTPITSQRLRWESRGTLLFFLIITYIWVTGDTDALFADNIAESVTSTSQSDGQTDCYSQLKDAIVPIIAIISIYFRGGIQGTSMELLRQVKNDGTYTDNSNDNSNS